MTQFIIFIKHILKGQIPCLFHMVTGLYCPGCGGTRAVIFLLTGHPILSFIYHPIVLYSIIILLYFILRNLLSLLSNNKICHKAKFHPAYLWIALGLVAINFIIKNLALISFGIDLMPLR